MNSPVATIAAPPIAAPPITAVGHNEDVARERLSALLSGFPELGQPSVVTCVQVWLHPSHPSTHIATAVFGA